MKIAFTIFSAFLTFSYCSPPQSNQNYSHSDGYTSSESAKDSITISSGTEVSTSESKNEWDYTTKAHKIILTGNTTPQQLLSYAETLQGIPYKYGSIDPDEGFDCSGFITYLFRHFNIAVPRSSIDFTDVEREISIREAAQGDIILFTGTDSTIRVVGHMGIISSQKDEEIKFIHSTSGKADGVTITPLNSYYQGRFVKVIRIFKEE